MTAPLPDHARSDDPVLDRLLRAAAAQRFGGDTLSLDRIGRLMARMASPHRKLPPVFHVAGTNGKGSTVAFLRAALEASGHRVHVFTSPHLVRVNERIRLAGQLVSDADFAEALSEVLRFNAGQPLSFFEAITSAAFLLFAATPADAVILEVGLGGRLDATNIVDRPLVTGIASLAMDHAHILGPTLIHIAREKAGIAKPGVPLVTQAYPPPVAAAVAEVAMPARARLLARGDSWNAAATAEGLSVTAPGAADPILLPRPALPGRHQEDNAALAVAMLRAQRQLAVADAALRSAMGWVQWPGRLQQLATGALAALLPAGARLFVDGGHNPAAARALAAWAAASPDRPLHLVTAMLRSKDHAGFLKAFARGTRITAVPLAGHSALAPADLAALAAGLGHAADTADRLDAAIAGAAPGATLLVCGSLHLAGEALALNGTPPA